MCELTLEALQADIDIARKYMSERQKPWTPGPWAIRDLGTPVLDDCPEFSIHDASGYIATVNSSRSETPHNARLIAAAPELVDFVERFHKATTQTEIWRLGNEAKALLAKIYGDD